MVDAYGMKNGFLALIPRQNGHVLAKLWHGYLPPVSFWQVSVLSHVAHRPAFVGGLAGIAAAGASIRGLALTQLNGFGKRSRSIEVA